MSNNECRFYPVQCSDETFQTLTAQEGYVYFVTDKKKIFLGKHGKMIPMCATSGFFYGIKEIEYDNSGIMPDPNVIFYYDEIEGSDIPEEDDLILNMDGCFYRVKNVAEDGLETVRLTLQGTGGGGGGNTPGGDPTGGNFSISVIDGKAKTYASTATEMLIKFKGNYNGTDGNLISSVAFKRKGDDEPFYVVDEAMAFNQEQTIDIFKYKHLFNTNKTTVTMYVYDLYGTERSTNLTVQIVDLELAKTKSDLIASFSNSYTYSCQLIGATSGVSDKKITYLVYAEDNAHTPVITYEKSLTAAEEDEIQFTMNLSSLPHGVYVLKVQASAKIVGSTTVLTSNTLTHKIARFDSASHDPLLMVFLPEKTEQFTNIPVQYMLLAQESNKDYTLDLSLDGNSQTKLAIKSNVADDYTLYFETKGTYTFEASVIELNLTYSTYLTISPYTGNLPVIDSSRSDLMLYLNPRNKSNDAVDRNEWNDYNGAYKGTLTGLHYGTANGWLLDDSGASYLKLSSGATFLMPNFRPFEKDPTKIDAADSRMGSGMTIELDFELNGVLDYDTELISCLSRNKDNEIRVGFSVTGDRVRFYSSRGVLLSLNLVEGKRTRVSFVIEPNTGTIQFPMIYGYVNGKLSGAVIYDSSADNFKDVSDGPALLRMDSEDAQIKVYGVRVYTTALGDRVILNNYTASLATLEERQASYDSNNVYDSNGKIDYIKVAAEDYNLQVPYMVLTGGYATEKESKWQRKDSSDTEGRLPTGKKDYRMVDVKVHYPKTPLFANYQDYEFVNQFKSGNPMATAYGEKPSNGGAIMYAQGTSSMEYPVKNLRLRFKNETDWYTVKTDIAPVEIICMKADYMESSGSHNTGSANLIDALYQSVGMKTPGQREFGGEGKPSIVTCIKGHPCLIFYSPTGAEGSYEYIGKYNLNLDKATPKPFGFDHSDDFGWLHEGDEYYEVIYQEDGEEPFSGQEEPDESADYVGRESLQVVPADKKINAIHCFEFLDNAVDVCNFLGKKQLAPVENLTEEQFDNNKSGRYYIGTEQADGSMKYERAKAEFDPNITYYYNTPMAYHDTWYNWFTNKDNELVPGWTLGFESRYPEDRIGEHDADMLYPLASWLNELNTLRETGPEGKKEANARFRNEYQCYLNEKFTLTYYLYTEALLMADSRVKNMMIATWGKENYGENGKGIGTNDAYSYYPLTKNEKGEWVPDKTQPRIYTNNYIFYPIFYDMDTMLGLDNTGVYRFNYYDEDTNPSIYNGEEVLWTFVRDALLDKLTPWYSELETATLTADKVLPYFNNNQANLANEAFYNGDAKYKYTDPARNGYHDDLYDKDIAAGDGPYLYAAQGDRSLMREWFVTNRFKFLRGKYASGQFKGGDRIEYRWYFPTGNEDEFKVGIDGQNHSASVGEGVVPPNDSFTLTSLKTGFAGIQVGANASTVHTVRFDGEETKTVVAPEAGNANGTEAYILGLSGLSDLGDLSNKYMQKFIIGSSDVRLKHLTLGNPHRDYYNPYWKVAGEGLSLKIGLTGATYLETFNLQNCITYNNSLDFSACPAIQKILLTGSGVSAINLPRGGMLSELRLPTSVTAINIDTHTGLQADKFSLGGYNYDNADPRIGFAGNYTNDFSRVASLKVIDTPIDTYAIVKDAGNLEEYCLRGIDWNITSTDTQYCIRYNNDSLTPEQIRSYYVYNSTSKSYEPWGQDTYPTAAGTYLYEKFDMVVDGKIVCIPALEYLMTKSIIDSSKHAEALTGKITLNLTGVTANELELYKRYIDTYPDVSIEYGSGVTVEGAHRVNFYYTDKDSLGDDGVTGLTPYFSVLTADNEKTLAELINTPAFANPNKSSSANWTYTFTGCWTDVNTNKVYYQDNAFDAPEDYPDAIAFSTHYPNADMALVPHFASEKRVYKIEFYNYDYPAMEEPLFVIEGYYEDKLTDLIDEGNWHSQIKYQYRGTDENLSEHERYMLKGWIGENDFNNQTANPTIYDFENALMTHDLKLFAHYIIENAQAVPLPYEMFELMPRMSIAIDGTVVEGSYIALAADYASRLGGKITLPSVDQNGDPITILGPFYRNALITDIYFLPDAKYKYAGDSCCCYMANLKNVYLPETMTMIGQDAFSNSTKLETVPLSDEITHIGYQAFYNFGSIETGSLGILVEKLPAKLEFIGDRAFCNAGRRVSVKDLPATVKSIGTQAFMQCSNVSISHFGGEGSALTSIGYQAFRSANTIAADVTELVINKGVILKLGNNDTAYNTFGMGYPNVTTLRIGDDCQTKYGNDTSALVADLFEQTGRNITVSTIM